MISRRSFVACLTGCCLASTAWTVEAAAAGEYFVYIGTYTGAKSKGIYRARFDAAKGRLSAPELAAETPSPSFLALHPSQAQLYSVDRPVIFAANESGTRPRGGQVSAFSVDRASGALTPLNQQSSQGEGPCHLAVDRTGHWVLVANYGSGSIATLPIRADGSLGTPAATVQHRGSSVNRGRQSGPHAHWAGFDPSNQFALICDLGLDQVLVYRFDPATGALQPNDPPHFQGRPGAGPRHLALAPDGKFAALINELDSTLSLLAWDAGKGAFRESTFARTLPEGFTNASTTAEVEWHPNGKFIYGSNRGHDSIAVFGVDTSAGQLKLLQHQPSGGRTPRNFALDPTGRWLIAANQSSDNLAVFRVGEDGRLTPTDATAPAGSPVCVVYVPVK